VFLKTACMAGYLRTSEAAASSLGVRVSGLTVHDRAEIEHAILPSKLMTRTPLHSMTSSASVSTVAGTSIPSVLAVLRLEPAPEICTGR
jgi:hypothetical protein